MSAGLYKSVGPITITGMDNVHLKCDVNDGSVVNGVRELFSNSFAISSPPGHKIQREPRIKLYLEDDDHNPVHFSNKMINFTSKKENLVNK